MSIRKSITVLTNTGKEWNVVSEPVKANAFYGYGDGLHTVQVIYHDFTGAFGIQGTLALNPTEDDWFFIKIDGDRKMIHYPANEFDPTGIKGDSGSDSFTFVGNYTHIRVVINRDCLGVLPPATSWDTWEYGQVDKVLLSL